MPEDVAENVAAEDVAEPPTAVAAIAERLAAIPGRPGDLARGAVKAACAPELSAASAMAEVRGASGAAEGRVSAAADSTVAAEAVAAGGGGSDG